jgi:acetylornithine deacetylase
VASSPEDAVLAAVERRRDELVELAAELVRVPSTLGQEEPAQRIVEQYLGAAGFDVVRVTPDADAALADEDAGYPPFPYDGRSSVVGTLGDGRRLHLSGHVDVVPVEEPERWTREPWSGAVADGRLWGRGAGDMKAGLAAYLVAAAALAEVLDRPGLVVSSVIEEECGGNGMWSVLRTGQTADATLIGEPTGFQLGHSGIGVVWARLDATGEGGHAMGAAREDAFDRLARGVAALRRLEAELNEPVDGWPYGLNVGEIRGGVWPSSMPARMLAHVRLGFGPELAPSDVQRLIRERVREAAPDLGVEFEGFRARAYTHAHDGPIGTALRSAHRSLLGKEAEPAAFTATTDARFVDGDCLCYGPTAGNLHGGDEWVDLESVRQAAVVVALAAARFLQPIL